MNVLVGSGKGGVGKSSLATALAVGLAELRGCANLLDADLAGPSLPVLLGVTGPVHVRANKMVPLEIDGVSSMSTGYLMPPERAVVWNGAMLAGALQQFLFDVWWPTDSNLIVDMPPGTNEVHVRLLEALSPDCQVVVVTTDDAVAIADTARAIGFWRELGKDPSCLCLMQRNGAVSIRGAVDPRLSAQDVPVLSIGYSETLSAPPLTRGRVSQDPVLRDGLRRLLTLLEL